MSNDKPLTSISPSTGSFGSDFYPAPQYALNTPASGASIYATVGEITSEWARMEHTLDLIIWEMAGIDPAKAACITAQLMGHSPRFLTIIALGTYLKFPQPLLTEIEVLGNKINNAANLRNRIVHDPWYVFEATGQHGQFRAMPKKELEYGVTPIDPVTFKQTVTEIQRRLDQCVALRAKIVNQLTSLRGK